MVLHNKIPNTPPKTPTLVPVVCKHNQSVLFRGVADCDWRVNRVQLVWTTKFSVWLPSLRRTFSSRDHAVIKDQAFIESTSRKIVAKLGK